MNTASALVTGNLGKRIADMKWNKLAHAIAMDGAAIVHREVRNSIHHITHETERSLKIRDATKNEYHSRAEVYTSVPWAIQLEFHQKSFMRAGAKKARKHLRQMIKDNYAMFAKGAVRLRNKGDTSVTTGKK